MERAAAPSGGLGLQEILDELHITSLDDSDIEAGLQEVASEDAASLASGPVAIGLSLGPEIFRAEDAGPLLEEESSTESATSATIRAALAAGDSDGEAAAGTAQRNAAVAALEAQLRLTRATLAGQPGLPLRFAGAAAAAVPDARAAEQHEELPEARQRQELPLPEAPLRRTAVATEGEARASAATAVATASFRWQMSDLEISEACYQAQRGKPEDELSVREWIQLRFHEAKSKLKAEAERLRVELEAMRENHYAAEVRAERAERQLLRREAAVTALTEELEAHQQQGRAELERVTAELRSREHEVTDIQDKGRRFDEVFREAARLREEAQTLREALAAQSVTQQRLGEERVDASERLLQLEGEHRLARQDAESHERRARLLEESLARRDEEVAELRAKVESLREKKRELARKATAEQLTTAHDVHDQVNAEIKRFKEQAQADLEAVRTNLHGLHEKEVMMLKERIEASNGRIGELQRRLEDEEQAHQALQLSAGRVRGELQNEITELQGNLKLRAFEVERAALTHAEVGAARERLETENEQLRQQVEVLRKEYYELEVQHREGRASERAELASLREQLQGYVQVEQELDAAIRACGDGPGGPAGGEAAAPQSVDEALLIGTTLGRVPTSAQRRIQQSLLLAQELQRRTREALRCREALGKAEAEVERLQEELEASRRELHYSSEPQAYLLEGLRRRESEVLALRRQLKVRDAELERSREQAEQAVSEKVGVTEDLRKLLAQRQHLDGVKALLDSEGMHTDKRIGDALGIGAAEGHPPQRAEHLRGRAPSQAPHSQAQAPLPAASSAAARQGFGGGLAVAPEAAKSGETMTAYGPIWFQRLREQRDAPSSRGAGVT